MRKEISNERLKVTGIVFLIILNSFIKADEPEKQGLKLLDKLKLNVQAVGTYKRSLINEQANLPYHDSYYLKLNFSLEPIDGLTVDFTLFPQNKSFSNYYYLSSQLNFRTFAEYIYYDMPKNFKFKTRYGDLSRIKIGEGLTFDEIDSEGIKLLFKHNDFEFNVYSLNVGLTGNEDVYSFNLNYKDNALGTTFTYIPFTGISNNQYQCLYALHGHLLFFNIFTVYSEFNYNVNVFDINNNSTSNGYLVGVNADYKDETQELSFQTELRRYEMSFNDMYNVNPRKIYQGQDTLDKKTNNWWNYLQFSTGTIGRYLRLYYKREVYSIIWIQGETEYLDIIQPAGDVKLKVYLFYNIGFVFNFTKGFDFLIAWTNKSPPSELDFVSSGDLFINHQHILTRLKLNF